METTTKKTSFDLLKNGKNSTTVWANSKTKEIYPANKNCFSYNAEFVLGDWFYETYGKKMKTNQGKKDFKKFYYSEKSMNAAGFILVKRGETPLF